MDTFTSENLIFLVSQPRSGSTMLQRILAGQPQIHTTAEPWIMLHPIYALRSQGHDAEYNARLAHEALRDFYGALPDGQGDYEEAIRRMAFHLYGSATEQAGKRLFLDKTPRYYLVIPDLARIMSRARFIILLRNPLAVLNSMLNAYVKERWLLLPRLRNDLLLAPRLLVEARELLQERALVVQYETLVSEPEAQVAAICAWLGLTFQPAMLDYGDRQFAPNAMGDFSDLTEPTTSRLNGWLQLGGQAQTRHLAQNYLEALGPELLAAMGYDYDDLKNQLLSQPARAGEVEVTWQQLFEPDPDFKKRIQYAETALLLERRLLRRLRRLLRRG